MEVCPAASLVGQKRWMIPSEDPSLPEQWKRIHFLRRTLFVIHPSLPADDGCIRIIPRTAMKETSLLVETSLYLMCRRLLMRQIWGPCRNKGVVGI